MADLYDVWDDYSNDPAFAPMRGLDTHLVKGWGRFDRPVAMIVAGVAGATEVAHDRPIAGPSGLVLNRLLGIAGIAPDETYQTLVLKYRTSGRHHTAAMLHAATPYLRREFSIVRPRCLIALGPTAHDVLDSKHVTAGLPGAAGQMYMLGNVPYWPMLHPGSLLRSRQYRDDAEDAWNDFGAWWSHYETTF